MSSNKVLLSKQDQYALQVLEDLNKPRGDGIKAGLKSRLHPDQIEQLKPLYLEGKKDLFLSCGRKYGKDIALDEPVLTPTGFKPIRDIHEGDYVISGKGIPTKVNIESPIYTTNKCYKVYFQDGTIITAGEDHKWEVGNKHDSWKVLQTKELTPNWYRTKLPIVKGEQKELLLDPYLLGLWLGDGSSHDAKITTIDEEVLQSFAQKFEIGCKDRITYYVKGMKPILRELNLLKNKHIPDEYMTASYEQRLDLLKGLMDTDGYTDSKGICEFVQKDEHLFNQVIDLMRSLGLRVQPVKDKEIEGKFFKRLSTSANKQIFKLERKASKLEPHIHSIRRKYKNIIRVEETDTVHTKCIGVECDSHTFITRNYTVTHNTELIGYVLWKHALENPGSACYYVCTQNTHAREIIWRGGRIQRYMGADTAKYIDGITNQDMTIRLKNGSFIRCIGSDNYMIANGLTPSIAVYDEFKGFNPRWHTEFAPNRAAKAAPLVIIGTKPRAGNVNMDQYNEILEYMRNDPNSYVADRSTFDNPINHLPEQKKVIDQEIAQLRARGEEDVVQLEYFSKVIPGGKQAIFPMFRRDTHIHEHSTLLREIEKDRKRLQWCLIADPGNTTCFALLFAAFNEYTGKLYLLDEMYVTNQNETSVGQIVPKAKLKAMELYPNSDINDDWMKACDDAAVWFQTEALSRYGVYFSPAEKFRGTKEDGLSLIKDQLIHNLVKISDKCVNLADEMEKYAKDLNGKIPKKHDHLIDCFRYLNGVLHYDFHTITEAVTKKEEIIKGRFRHPNDGILDDIDNDDWTANIGDDDGFDFDL